MRPIGSDFEWPDDAELVGSSPSPAFPDGGIYVESGRQALMMLARELTDLGHGCLVLPSYFCDSMVQPFITLGWQLQFVNVDRLLRMQAPALVETVRRVSGNCAILHAPYFGIPPTTELITALDWSRHEGAVVIEDVTHTLFDQEHWYGTDFRVASLRKLLALPDGGVVWGVRAAQPPPSAAAPAHVRVRAMLAKRHFLDLGTRPQEHRGLFRDAEMLTDERLEAHGMSTAAKELLARMPLPEYAYRRRSNLESLLRGLKFQTRFMPLLVDYPAYTPSHLVIVGPDARGLRAALAGEGIYCPIHWPEPTRVMVSRWPGNLISLPLDQRYNSDDMQRIADAVSAYRIEL